MLDKQGGISSFAAIIYPIFNNNAPDILVRLDQGHNQNLRVLGNWMITALGQRFLSAAIRLHPHQVRFGKSSLPIITVWDNIERHSARTRNFIAILLLTWLLLAAPAKAASDVPIPDDLVNCTPLIVVTSKNDDGAGSLRQAIKDICDGGQISFNLPPGSFITLLTGELIIDKSLQLLGPGSATLALRSLDDGRLLHISSGVAVQISDLSLLNGLATNNAGGISEGGAIRNEGTLTLTRVTLVGNSAAAPGRGGGIANLGGIVTIMDSIFADNLADGNNGIGDGGAIYNDANGVITIADTTFLANAAYANGGAIDNHGALTISNSVLSENSSFTGGGIANRGGELSLSSSSLFQNTANVYGGGILNTGSLLVNASTLSGNESAGGGGIHNNGGSVMITHSTVTLNQATQGGGISGTEAGAITLQNSIVAQNSAEECALPASALLSQGHNLTGDSSCHLTEASDLAQQDARLAPLLLNGGDTETHALLPGSPALDAGQCAADSVDQRGQLRPVDIPSLSDSGNGCDIGAYEASNTPLSLTVGMMAQSPLLPGQPVTYTLRFQNESDSLVSQAFITNTLSLPLTDLTFTSNGVSVTPVAGPVPVWQVANLSPGAGGVITVTARVSATWSADALLVNSALIRGHSNLTDFADGWNEASLNVAVPHLAFALESYRVQENAGTATITITLTTPNPFAPVSVSYETIDGSAMAGKDYVGVSGQITMLRGASQQTFIVPILDNMQADGSRSLTLRLSAPVGAALGTTASAPLTVTDNDYTLLLPMVFRP